MTPENQKTGGGKIKRGKSHTNNYQVLTRTVWFTLRGSKEWNTRLKNRGRKSKKGKGGKIFPGVPA